MARAYVPRLVDSLVGSLLAELPALQFVGPRATGKTTTALRHAATVIRLDQEAVAAAFRADPDAALRELEEPVLLDEWQAVPGVLSAVKRAVDSDARPGRFIITGSVRADLDAQTWPGTGRLVRVPMWGFTVRELEGLGARRSLIDLIEADGPGALRVLRDPPDLRGYVELALRGGFPDAALHASPPTARRWLESYVDQLLTRDVEMMDGPRDPDRLGRYFEALAVNTGGLVSDTTLAQAAGISRKTATAYEQLLKNLLVLDRVPAWFSNRLKRLVRSPKRYLADPALVAAVLRVDVNGVLRDGDLLGRLLDTFVVAQLRPETVVCQSRPRLHHLRQGQDRHEVDIVLELGGHRVIAIEVKAESGPDARAARHLRWLRDEIREQFVLGLVLHTGPKLYELDERVIAAPICALWS